MSSSRPSSYFAEKKMLQRQMSHKELLPDLLANFGSRISRDPGVMLGQVARAFEQMVRDKTKVSKLDAKRWFWLTKCLLMVVTGVRPNEKIAISRGNHNMTFQQTFELNVLMEEKRLDGNWGWKKVFATDLDELLAAVGAFSKMQMPKWDERLMAFLQLDLLTKSAHNAFLATMLLVPFLIPPGHEKCLGAIELIVDAVETNYTQFQTDFYVAILQELPKAKVQLCWEAMEQEMQNKCQFSEKMRCAIAAARMVRCVGLDVNQQLDLDTVWLVLTRLCFNSNESWTNKLTIVSKFLNNIYTPEKLSAVLNGLYFYCSNYRKLFHLRAEEELYYQNLAATVKKAVLAHLLEKVDFLLPAHGKKTQSLGCLLLLHLILWTSEYGAKMDFALRWLEYTPKEHPAWKQVRWELVQMKGRGAKATFCDFQDPEELVYFMGKTAKGIRWCDEDTCFRELTQNYEDLTLQERISRILKSMAGNFQNDQQHLATRVTNLFWEPVNFMTPGNGCSFLVPAKYLLINFGEMRKAVPMARIFHYLNDAEIDDEFLPLIQEE